MTDLEQSDIFAGASLRFDILQNNPTQLGPAAEIPAFTHAAQMLLMPFGLVASSPSSHHSQGSTRRCHFPCSLTV